jgi:phenylpyruvate tautomerase PptA (4-oxalocrotonate tautomerase family)
MPLVTMTLAAARDDGTIERMLDAVHAALVESGVPPADRFQRVLVPGGNRLRYDARYPDLPQPRSDRFVLIEILWSVGRSVKVKRALADRIATDVAARAEIDRNDVMIVFVETAWENWAFAGGRLLHAQ